LKARTTWNSASATGSVRTVLGGHGYSSLSKMAAFYHDVDVNTTWEGDNNLLLQQTSKFLIKVIRKQK
jgi:acyl-CoA oxidase